MPGGAGLCPSTVGWLMNHHLFIVISSWEVDGTDVPTYWFVDKDPLLTYQNWYRQAIYFDLKVSVYHHPKATTICSIKQSHLLECPKKLVNGL